MTSKEMRKASEWAKQQRKSVGFELPDRQPGEPRATQKQLDYIRSMVRGIDENTLNSLGKWQASAFIDQAKTERAIFTQEKVEEYRGRRGLKSFFTVVIIIAVIWILWKMATK